MRPLVSIVTPMYNNAAVINETIQSVISQTYPNWELILIDDCSEDYTQKVVAHLLKLDTRIKYYEHSNNKGAAEARNLGTKMAKGDFIAFLDADDLWAKDKLEVQLNLLNTSRADVCFGSYEWIDAMSNPLNIKVQALKILSYKKLLKANYIGNLTGIYNCKKLGKIFTKDLKKRQDWLLWLEALRRSEKPAVGIAETIAYYRITDGSLSSNKINLIKHNFKVYNKGLGLPYIKSTVYLLRFLFEHLIIKKRLIKKLN